MRALVTGRDADRRRAWASAASVMDMRSAAWIITECAFDLIDRPLPEVPTQWIEPAEDVQRRWYDIIHGIISRSALGQIIVDD